MGRKGVVGYDNKYTVVDLKKRRRRGGGVVGMADGWVVVTAPPLIDSLRSARESSSNVIPRGEPPPASD